SGPTRPRTTVFPCVVRRIRAFCRGSSRLRTTPLPTLLAPRSRPPHLPPTLLLLPCLQNRIPIMASRRFFRIASLNPWIVAGAVALTRLAHVSPAYAEPSAADRETARSLMNEGDAKFDAKNYAQALKAYQGAHAIMGLPSTGYAVARTQAALGQLVEA